MMGCQRWCRDLTKEGKMKKICLFVLVAACLFVLPAANAQEYGKIRALQERAAHITWQKNQFIINVLNAYKVPCEVNEQGAIVRLQTDNKWLTVKTIEILPVLQESAQGARQVTAHELFFFTDEGILHLMSALTIR